MFLLNYDGEKFELPIKKEIFTVFINVLSGDEIATIVYKDGTEDYFDSAILANSPRIIGYDDGSYVAFKNGEWIPGFETRDSSYWDW